jgi:anti-sigma B factor antagonist
LRARAFLVDSLTVRSYYHPTVGDGICLTDLSVPSEILLPRLSRIEISSEPGSSPMILQLQKSNPAPDICLMEFSGKLMMGNDSRQVEWGVTELLGAGIKKIIFDLSKVDSIDSTGVGIIVVCEAKVRKAGGALRIAGPEGIVHDTLVMTHVDRLVKFFPTANAAAQDFSVS